MALVVFRVCFVLWDFFLKKTKASVHLWWGDTVRLKQT